MNRVLLIVSLIFFFGCSNQSGQLSDGLTRRADKVTEYLINTVIDSLNGLPIDTLTKTEKIYNKNGQIIKRIQDYAYRDNCMIIDFKYDKRKRLKKELVELINDSITFSVDYYYNGTLLDKTKSEFSDREFWTRHIGQYYYDSNNILKSSTLLQQFIDLETKDTLTNTFELNKYNENKQLIETNFRDSLNLDKNRIFKYDYKDERLFKASEYNQHDSLISITLFVYKLDKFGNWIERKTHKNNVMTSLIKREIVYK